jgi:hypothetical protein
MPVHVGNRVQGDFAHADIRARLPTYEAECVDGGAAYVRFASVLPLSSAAKLRVGAAIRKV